MSLIGSKVVFDQYCLIEDKKLIAFTGYFEGVLVGPPDYEQSDFLSVSLDGKIVMVAIQNIIDLPIDWERFNSYTIHFGD